MALCSLIALSGCSALRIGYATAPDIVYWWLDRYVDLDDAQTPPVRAAIKQWFGWNRRTQLADYGALLARAQSEVLADTTPARVCEWQGEVLKRAHVAFDQIAPSVADLMLTITPQQVRHIEQRYAKVNTEFREDFLQADAARRAEVTRKRVIDRAEMLYGKLDDAQRERIDEGLKRSPFDADLWFAERRFRQQDLLQGLRKLQTTEGGASREQAQALLRGYVERLERSPRDNYRRYYERLTEFNCAFAAGLHNATSAAQRKTAAGRLAGWQGDLRAIAAAAEPVTAP
ncbi:MAG: DUF6279 family lipoprotein [Pseudomonadota bacterium]